MERLFVIVRHGHDNGQVLSDSGRKQMWSLWKVINATVTEVFAGEVVTLFLSFSDLDRAFQSVRELRFYGEDIIVLNLSSGVREGIKEPEKILQRVVGIADYYHAQIIIAVAHGDMPAVIAETAHKFITGETLEKLPSPDMGCGYIINLGTGEVGTIRFDSPR